MEWEKYGEITEVANSIRKYFDLETYHNTDQTTDEWLNNHQFRCVITLLIDGMGTELLEKYADENSFLKRHMSKSVTTVFPPTTTAATTSFRNGKSPCENAWLGWNQYFKEEDDNIILFLNKSQYSDKMYPAFSWETLPVRFMTDELNDQGMKADTVWPAWGESHPSKDYIELLENTLKLSKDPDMKLIYTYWDVLDSYMHRYGPSDQGTARMLKAIDQVTEQFAYQLPEDVGLMIVADHGHIDIKVNDLEEYPQLVECFEHLPANEGRSCVFYIKEEKKEFFVKEFNRIFGNHFVLMTKDEVIENEVFGNGIAHPRFEDFVGDYLAVSYTDHSLVYKVGHAQKGNHAGGTDEEMYIPLILFAKKNNVL